MVHLGLLPNDESRKDQVVQVSFEASGDAVKLGDRSHLATWVDVYYI